MDNLQRSLLIARENLDQTGISHNCLFDFSVVGGGSNPSEHPPPLRLHKRTDCRPKCSLLSGIIPREFKLRSGTLSWKELRLCKILLKIKIVLDLLCIYISKIRLLNVEQREMPTCWVARFWREASPPLVFVGGEQHNCYGSSTQQLHPSRHFIQVFRYM